MKIKKVIKNIYSFDLKKCSLQSGSEMILTNHGNEFVVNFRKRDIDSGLIITPGNYTKGLIYKSTNGGEFYNNPGWVPDLVMFSYDLFGLKKGAFYRITIKGRNTRIYNRLLDITDNRKLEITNGSSELVLEHDFSDDLENVSVDGIFRSNSVEEILFFTMGKIYINNIIIDEVEILANDETENEKNEENINHLKSKEVSAYAVFSLKPEESKVRYSKLERVSGYGVNLYYDKNSASYILERDTQEDTLGASFTNSNFIVDFNFNKVVNYGIFDNYSIVEVSNDIAPNSLKQGFIRFQLIKNGKPILYNNDNGRLIALISEIEGVS